MEIEDALASEKEIPELINNRTYHFALVALNGAGESNLSEVKTAQTLGGKPPGVPNQPSTLPLVEEGKVEVAWEPPSDLGTPPLITGYKVYYRLTSEGTLTKADGNVVEVPDASKRMAAVSGLSNGVEYQFALAAVNVSGVGALSSIKKFTLRPERTVSFKTYGTGAGDTKDFTVKVDYGYSVGEPVIPTRAGKNFAGWYEESGFTLEYDFAAPVTTDRTLYAKWDDAFYNIIFDADGGTFQDGSNRLEVSDKPYYSKLEEPEVPAKTGKDFLGWYTLQNGGGRPVELFRRWLGK